MAAGEKDKMVQQICNISSDSSSEYDSGGEISSQSSMACVTSTTSTNETARNETASIRSLLSILRRPTSSDLCRKRIVRQNPPKGKKRKVSSSSCSTDPKSVTPAQRCSEFPGEFFGISAGKLFCHSCREELSLKRSIIKNHVASLKHKTSKSARTKQQIADKSIVESLKAYEANANPRGESLPEAQKLYRVKVVTVFLKAGIPLTKVESLREILEEHAYR